METSIYRLAKVGLSIAQISKELGIRPEEFHVNKSFYGAFQRGCEEYLTSLEAARKKEALDRARENKREAANARAKRYYWRHREEILDKKHEQKQSMTEEQRERERSKHSERHEAHKAKARERMRMYRQQNPEKTKKQNRLYYLLHRDEMLKNAHAYYKNNREKILAKKHDQRIEQRMSNLLKKHPWVKQILRAIEERNERNKRHAESFAG